MLWTHFKEFWPSLTYLLDYTAINWRERNGQTVGIWRNTMAVCFFLVLTQELHCHFQHQILFFTCVHSSVLSGSHQEIFSV